MSVFQKILSSGALLHRKWAMLGACIFLASCQPAPVSQPAQQVSKEIANPKLFNPSVKVPSQGVLAQYLAQQLGIGKYEANKRAEEWLKLYKMGIQPKSIILPSNKSFGVKDTASSCKCLVAGVVNPANSTNFYPYLCPATTLSFTQSLYLQGYGMRSRKIEKAFKVRYV